MNTRSSMIAVALLATAVLAPARGVGGPIADPIEVPAPPVELDVPPWIRRANRGTRRTPNGLREWAAYGSAEAKRRRKGARRLRELGARP